MQSYFFDIQGNIFSFQNVKYSTWRSTFDNTMSKRNVPEKNGGPVEPYRDVSGQMVVDRQVYSETELSSQYTAKKTPKPTIPQRAGNIFRDTCACSAKCWRDAVYQYLPFIRIMKKYNIKRDLVGDIVAGITVGIVQIPQGRTGYVMPFYAFCPTDLSLGEFVFLDVSLNKLFNKQSGCR